VSAGSPSEEALAKVRLKFADDGKLLIRDSLSERETTFKLNSAARLKEIDIIEEGGGTTAGVYELDGDTLRIALPSRGDTTRPTELKVDCDGTLMVLTLKRVKDE
jgi:uncharacterized protein (TIGR03067 family)